MIQITLPWFDKALKRNGTQAHWAKKARAVKAAREMAWALTLEALQGRKVDWKAVKLHWVFHPKTANVPDGDNMEAQAKHYRDGIADALGLDDKHFTATREIAQPIKGGAVIVHIQEG